MIRLLALLVLLTHPASAQCRLALALALDVSSSVDQREYRLQRNGVAQALLSDEVQALLFAGHGHVAVAVYEWSGQRQHAVLLDWTLLDGPRALTRAAEEIFAATRSHSDYPTALGSALGFGSTLLRRAPDCARHTLDVSGDGINNDGYAPHHAYGAFPFRGVTVNGLVIRDTGVEVDAYYHAEVIRGPGAFVILTHSYEDYADAMQRKLVREIGEGLFGGLPRQNRMQGG